MRIGRSFPARPIFGRIAVGGSSAQAVATLAGTSDLTVIGKTLASSVGTLAGAGVLVISGATQASAAVSIVGVGALSVVGAELASGAATISASGSLSAVSAVSGAANATLAGAGALNAAGQETAATASAIVGAGAVSAVGAEIAAGAAMFAGSAILAAVGDQTAQGVGAATLAGSGALSLVGATIAAGAATLSGSASLDAVSVPTASVDGGFRQFRPAIPRHPILEHREIRSRVRVWARVRSRITVSRGVDSDLGVRFGFAAKTTAHAVSNHRAAFAVSSFSRQSITRTQRSGLRLRVVPQAQGQIGVADVKRVGVRCAVSGASNAQRVLRSRTTLLYAQRARFEAVVRKQHRSRLGLSVMVSGHSEAVPLTRRIAESDERDLALVRLLAA